ncbi:hypothetical protein CDD83_11111 [Cordyceps sp. RAO-2017]|nr:hypothetical protein CDD83_11111 [Cordyceps sp. RAO-2017]
MKERLKRSLRAAKIAPSSDSILVMMKWVLAGNGSIQGNRDSRVTRRGVQPPSAGTSKDRGTEPGGRETRTGRRSRRAHSGRATPAAEAELESIDGSPTPKRRKVAAPRGKKDAGLHLRLFSGTPDLAGIQPCLPPARLHSWDYHRPLLLSGRSGSEGRRRLLSWFDSASTTRGMPWRSPWIDPGRLDAADLRPLLERRAYEVWISEIMLQQTRVAVVVDYWKRWMARWPTIHDLAGADADDVLAAWRGLGYYSRATRIYQAAKLVVQDPDMRGLLPSAADELAARVPGVGRYTAGAISSIVFGRAEPMVDGNVLRVLSRQLGIHGNIKSDKSVIDIIWAAADALVKTVSQHDEGPEADHNVLERDSEAVPLSDRPGRWGQALMELGSTVCTPKPDCPSCPITSTCRVYAEGSAMASNKTNDAATVADMEDLCGLCSPLGGQETDGTKCRHALNSYP